MKVGSQVQKNGGNVASHFLTPDGRLIHSVTGPVSAKVLIAEAEWALATYDQAKQRASLRERIHYIASAHSQRSYQTKGQVQKVHQLLAAQPLPPISLVYEYIFEEILGQRVSKAGPRLAQAAARLQLAQRTGRPLLFIFHDDNNGQWGRSGPQSQGGYGPLTSSLISKYVVIVMPIREGPALSQLTKQPPYEVAGNRRPMFIVARSNGEQVDALAGWNDGYLAGAMARGWVDALERNPPPARDIVRATRFLSDAYPELAERTKQLSIRLKAEKAEKVKPPADRIAAKTTSTGGN